MYDFHARKNLRNWLPITFSSSLAKMISTTQDEFWIWTDTKIRTRAIFAQKSKFGSVLVFPRPIKKLTPNFYQCLRNSEDDSIFHARLAIFVHIVDIPNCQKHDSGILCNFLSLSQSPTNPTLFEVRFQKPVFLLPRNRRHFSKNCLKNCRFCLTYFPRNFTNLFLSVFTNRITNETEMSGYTL